MRNKTLKLVRTVAIDKRFLLPFTEKQDAMANRTLHTSYLPLSSEPEYEQFKRGSRLPAGVTQGDTSCCYADHIELLADDVPILDADQLSLVLQSHCASSQPVSHVHSHSHSHAKSDLYSEFVPNTPTNDSSMSVQDRESEHLDIY